MTLCVMCRLGRTVRGGGTGKTGQEQAAGGGQDGGVIGGTAGGMNEE